MTDIWTGQASFYRREGVVYMVSDMYDKRIEHEFRDDYDYDGQVLYGHEHEGELMAEYTFEVNNGEIWAVEAKW